MGVRDLEDAALNRVVVSDIFAGWWDLIFSEDFTDVEIVALVWWTFGWPFTHSARFFPRSDGSGDGVTRERARQVTMHALQKANMLSGGFASRMERALIAGGIRRQPRETRRDCA